MNSHHLPQTDEDSHLSASTSVGTTFCVVLGAGINITGCVWHAATAVMRQVAFAIHTWASSAKQGSVARPPHPTYVQHLLPCAIPRWRTRPCVFVCAGSPGDGPVHTAAVPAGGHVQAGAEEGGHLQLRGRCGVRQGHEPMVHDKPKYLIKWGWAWWVVVSHKCVLCVRDDGHRHSHMVVPAHCIAMVSVQRLPCRVQGPT